MRRAKCIIFIALFSAAPAMAATTVRGIDNVSFAAFASAASLTWTHVLGTCAHSVLVVSAGNDAGSVSGVTFAGIPLTRRANLTSTETAEIWTLSNSTTTGSGSIVVTNSAALDSAAGAVSFCGALDANPSDATATQQSTQVDPNIAVTVVSSGSWAVDSMYAEASVIPEAYSPPGTVIRNAAGTGTLIAHIVGPLGAGSNTLSWKHPTSRAWTKAVMSIKPSTGTPIVVTNMPTSVANTSMTGNGLLLNTGGFTVTQASMCISTSVNPTTSDTCFGPSNGASPYTFSITGLTAGTLYHMRMAGTNSEGTDYGVDIPQATTSTTIGSVKAGSGNAGLSTGGGNASVR